MHGIAAGEVLSGSIDVPGEVDFFTFTGLANDVVFLTLLKTGGTWTTTVFGPQATLFTPSGGTIATFPAGAEQQFTLPEAGTYIVRIRSDRMLLGSLPITGTYNLGFDKLLGG